jgi:citrate lyase subunit beta/citryl-CoA lyase
MPILSYLFVPATRPELISKAFSSGAHAVIVDLEDAVAPADKPRARANVQQWLTENPKRKVLVRVNGRTTEWFTDDLDVALHPGISAVVVSKSETAADLSCFTDKPLLPLIETALGFSKMAEIAAHPNVQRLIFGTYDFMTDLGIGSHPDALLSFKSQFVLLSRLQGLLPPVDGVMARLDDRDAWGKEALYSRQLGFGAKLCIHPAQVAIVNAAFMPSDDEYRWAHSVLNAVIGGEAIAVVEGQFVDRPVVARARAIVEARKSFTS